MIRLLVVDDHPVVRAGMVAVLGEESDFEVVGEAANGAEALGLVPRLRPDVVLMDLRMPVMDGTEATARITAEADAPHVLVLTTYDTDADIVRAVEAGARGYLLKDAPTGVLADAIRRAARGETVLAPPVTAAVRSVTPSLANARMRCVLTVASPMNSSLPMSALDSPRATSRNTSTSRPVSSGRAGSRSRSASRAATGGASTVSPRAARRIASASTPVGASLSR